MELPGSTKVGVRKRLRRAYHVEGVGAAQIAKRSKIVAQEWPALVARILMT